MGQGAELSSPYRKMATTCKTRPPQRKSIVWPKIDSVSAGDGRFRVGLLRRDLIEAASELWRRSYPEVSGSPHEFLLYPGEYEKLIALEDTWHSDKSGKVYCMLVVEELATGRIISATLLTKYEKNLQVEFSFAATDPDHRVKGLTNVLRRMTRKVADGSGAEYFTTFCETWHDITQKWCIKGGWKIAGIFPGNFIRWNGDGEEYRGCEVHFYRFAEEGEAHSTKPTEWRLAEEAKEVWEALERVNSEIERKYTPSRKTHSRME